MKAFDTDILTLTFAGNSAILARIAEIPVEDHVVPIVVAEEILRGRLAKLRQAEAGKTRITIDQAYDLFERTLVALREIPFLPFTESAEILLQDWRRRKIRGSTHDLRIAASCVTSRATLISRNRQDFESIPGLSVEFWD
jgi:tRNA(fMet)-specific endonuclease VapC